MPHHRQALFVGSNNLQITIFNLNNKYRFWSIFFFVGGTFIIVLIFINLESSQKTVANAFTLFGTYLSLYGILIAYLQIQSIKETSEKTKRAVEESSNRINQILSVSDLSKSNKVIQEIQYFLQNDKVELALLRMKDLKAILIQIKFNEDLIEYTENNLYNQNITDLGADINNLHDQITGAKKGINFSKVNQNLERLSTILAELENKLKYKN